MDSDDKKQQGQDKQPQRLPKRKFETTKRRWWYYQTRSRRS